MSAPHLRSALENCLASLETLMAFHAASMSAADRAGRERAIQEARAALCGRGADDCEEGTLVAPDGSIIMGTLDTIQACALIERARRKADGTLDFDWAGETKVYWDTQAPQTLEGRTLLMDESGRAWPEDQARIVGEES